MKSPTGRLFLLLTVAANTALAATVLPVEPANDGTYRITAKATHKFTRNTDKLKDQALAAATEFCTKDGKVLQVVSFEEVKSQYLVGRFPEVTLTFKSLAPGDGQAVSTVPGSPNARKPITTDELGAELTKLNELRKQGLLSDAEFEVLKQRLLSRF